MARIPRRLWAEHWADRVREAQQQTTTTIEGKVYPRTPFGEELYDAEASSCRDCGVARGQLHVPVCCCEQCPRCRGLRLSCRCVDEGLAFLDDPGA